MNKVCPRCFRRYDTTRQQKLEFLKTAQRKRHSEPTLELTLGAPLQLLTHAALALTYHMPHFSERGQLLHSHHPWLLGLVICKASTVRADGKHGSQHTMYHTFVFYCIICNSIGLYYPQLKWSSVKISWPSMRLCVYAWPCFVMLSAQSCPVISSCFCTSSSDPSRMVVSQQEGYFYNSCLRSIC